MKKIATILLCLSIIIFKTIDVYAEEIKVNYEDEIKVDKKDNSFQFKIELSSDETYAGAEFAVQCPEGAVVKSVDYNVQASKAGVTEQAGLYWFSFFAGENKFDGNITATIDVEYSGDKNIKVVVDSISVYKLENNVVNSVYIDENRKEIDVYKEGASNIIEKLEDVDYSINKGITNNKDVSSNNSNAVIGNNNNNSNAENNDTEIIKNEGEKNNTVINNKIENEDSLKDIAIMPKDNKENTLIIAALIISLFANVVLGSLLYIKTKNKNVAVISNIVE